MRKLPPAILLIFPCVVHSLDCGLKANRLSTGICTTTPLTNRHCPSRKIRQARKIGMSNLQPGVNSLCFASSGLEPNKTYRSLFGFTNWILNSLGKFFGKFRRRRYSVYVLECEDGKYYVGSTKNRERRMQEHMSERGGSKWTRRHPPIQLLEEYRRIPAAYYLGKESQVTAEYMLRCGVNNVRGSMFSDPRDFTMDDVDALTRFLGHYNNRNYKKVETWLETQLEATWKSRKRQKKKKQRAKKKPGRCYRCGKIGHWAYDCPELSDT